MSLVSRTCPQCGYSFENPAVAVGRLLLQKRADKGLSQEEVVAQLRTYGIELDATALLRAEKGRRSISITEGVALAEILDFDIKEFAK